jgi:hypothetical protein
MTRLGKERKKEEKVKGKKARKKMIIRIKFLILIRKDHLPGEENALLLVIAKLSQCEKHLSMQRRELSETRHFNSICQINRKACGLICTCFEVENQQPATTGQGES